jgi:tRNA A-37 threonylcarbamoyl transferase component Bud32
MTLSDDDSGPFDDYLDRVLRGERIDPDVFLRTNADLTEDERRQVRLLGARYASEARPPVRPGPDQDPDAPPVERLGGLRLVRRIGAGGMGAVYLAADETLGRPAAVKIMLPRPGATDAAAREDRFRREARALAKLRHPHIVAVHAYGEELGLRYLAMEYVPGRPWSEVLAAAAVGGVRPPVDDVLRVGAEIARALAAAHAEGVVHRDVKPSNVRITPEGRAVLVDFGVARDDADAALTATGEFCGSPQYASPEQADPARGTVDARTDVYSLGATLYEALTGTAPFRADSRERLFRAILSDDPLPPRRLAPNLSRDVETLVMAALDKDPARRPPTAAAFAADLEAARDGRPISVRRPTVLGRLWRRARRRPATAAAVLVAVAALATSAGLVVRRVSDLPKIRAAEAAERDARFDALLAAAFAEYVGHDSPAAAAAFALAERERPGAPEAVAGRALSLLSAGDRLGATSVLDGAADAFADEPWARTLRAEAAAPPADSRAEARAASRPAPRSALDHAVLGMLRLPAAGMNDVAAAEEAFGHLKRAVLAAPRPTAAFHYALGKAARRARRDADARDVAAAIVALFPDSPERRFALGDTLLHADPPRALDAFVAAADDPPASASSRFVVIVELAIAGRPDGVAAALRLARAEVAAVPAAPLRRYALGAALAAAGDFASAVPELRAALAADRAPADAPLQLAKALWGAKDAAGCLAVCDEALARDEGRDRALRRDVVVQRALARSQLGRSEESTEELAALVAEFPQREDVRVLYGLSLMAAGSLTAGSEAVRAAQAVGFTSEAWRERAARALAEAAPFLDDERRATELRARGPDRASAEELTRLALRISARQRRYAEAWRWCEKARADGSGAHEPSLGEAVAAALLGLAAGLGRGVDAPPDADARAALRARAFARLGEALDEIEALRRGGTDVKELRTHLVAWLTPRVFPNLASADPPVDLPADEHAAWRALTSRRDAALRPVSR